jgi:hypothetical protein
LRPAASLEVVTLSGILEMVTGSSPCARSSTRRGTAREFELSLLAGLASAGSWVADSRSGSTRAHLQRSPFCTESPHSYSLWAASAVWPHRGADVWQGLVRALATPQLHRLAPVWICMNAIIGLWLGHLVFRADESLRRFPDALWPMGR